MTTTPDRSPSPSAGLQIRALLGWLALCFTAAFVSTDGWYAGLNKPAWNPPAWVFAPAWTFLYATMAVAAWLVWREGGWRAQGRALGLFVLQWVVNALCTPLVFGLHRPGLALIDILALWLALAATLVACWRVRRVAGVLMLPHLAWVRFSTALNFAIWRLNPCVQTAGRKSRRTAISGRITPHCSAPVHDARFPSESTVKEGRDRWAPRLEGRRCFNVSRWRRVWQQLLDPPSVTHLTLANLPTQFICFMTKLATSREIRLASRPKGMPTNANFSLAETTLPPLQTQQVLVRNLFMSVDPYMRGRMNEGKSYVPPFVIGQALEGGAIGEVVESRANEFKPGDVVTSRYGWREAFVAAPKELRAVDKTVQPLSVYLGILGMPGMTAWAGLTLVEVKAGDVIFISGAAGAVGNVAGQLAKLRGCRVIGSAGSAEKVQSLLDECGFDAAFNYKTGPTLDQLNRAAPDGIDVYFDNVGGESLEAALSALRVHGRIIACGGISSYNDEQPKPGPANLFNMTTKRLTMKGLIVGDWLGRQSEFEKEVGGYFHAGKLKNKETVVAGIDHAVDAFLGLFAGKNTGKMVVKLT